MPMANDAISNKQVIGSHSDLGDKTSVSIKILVIVVINITGKPIQAQIRIVFLKKSV